MFCPKCGKSDQIAESYCRQCGVFLPDLSKPLKQTVPPEQHVKVNTVVSVMTIVTCFTLAILLYLFLGFREPTHPLIYLTAGLLLAMGVWHVQTLIRGLMLRKHFRKQKRSQEVILGKPSTTDKLLEQPDFENIVPASVTDRTTKNLVEPQKRSS
jgi:FlaA1/EpsC-like NDP-sugar epimerase